MGELVFWCLMPVEQQERHRQGLCYNYGELYASGHVCQRLLYLATNDYIKEVVPPQEGVVAPSLQEEAAPEANVA